MRKGLLVLLLCTVPRMASAEPQTILMNRLGPSQSDLYLASADGSNERKLSSKSGFDYHASFSPESVSET